MLRLRIVIPLSLLSSLASASAAAELTPRACIISPRSASCEAELERAFARARNAEINASIAAVNAARGWLAMSTTHCKTADSNTPRCLAERARELALALTHCKTPDSTTPRCEAERARDFAARRNAEMNTASACQSYNWLTARCDAGDVAALRNGEIVTGSACQPYNWLTSGCGAKRSSELAQSLTHCKTPNSSTPRCEAERAREFAAARNAEIEASLAAVAAERARSLAQSLTHCHSASVSTPRCEAERAREFAAARNAEIDASIAAVAAERTRAFAAARNAEIEASLAAVATERARELAQSLTYCKAPNSSTPRCEAERAREFAAARNAEIDASIAAVAAERTRAFAAARNLEINASIAAVQAEHTRAFAAARNAEINASIAAVAAERTRAFAAARNAEINASIAAVEAQRTLRQALMSSGLSHLETGAIGLPQSPSRMGPAHVKRETRYSEPCREASRIMSPLQFSDGGTEIEQDMMPELDRIAMMAKACPAIRIEIHGHSDNTASAKVNRYLAERRAQAAVAYLVQMGIAADRLAAIGHAETQPLAANNTAAERARNRRIEIRIHDPAVEAAAQRIMWDLAELLDPTYVPPLARLSP